MRNQQTIRCRQSSIVSSALRILINSQIVGITVRVDDCRILFDYVVFRNGDLTLLNIEYEKEVSGYRFKMNGRAERICSGDFMRSSIEHFKQFLSSVHKCSSFSIVTGSSSLYTSYLHHITEILRKRDILLKVNEFGVSIPSKNGHVASILSLLDPDALTAVQLNTPEMMSEQLLDQLFKFPNASTTIEASDFSDLLLLKEHCVRSGSPFGKFILKGSFDKSAAFELFGDPMDTGSPDYRWFFASLVDGYDVCVEQIDLEEDSSFTVHWVPTTERLKMTLSSPRLSINLVTFAKHFPPIMTPIVNNATFPTLLALRDVSRDLRTFIDRHHLHYYPIRMHVQFNTDSAIVRICGDGEEVTGNCSNISSSWLEKYDGFNNPAIQSFSCNFEGYSLQKMRELKNFLHSFKSKISMANLELKGNSEIEFIELLDCLEESQLRKLTISSSGDNNRNQALVLDQITENGHWKHAVDLVLIGANIFVSIQHLEHFLRVKASLETIPVEDVIFLKQVLLASSLPRNFKLATSDNFDLQSLSLGCPASREGGHHKWVFQAEKALEVKVHDWKDGKTCIQMRHLKDKSLEF